MDIFVQNLVISLYCFLLFLLNLHSIAQLLANVGSDFTNAGIGKDKTNFFYKYTTSLAYNLCSIAELV